MSTPTVNTDAIPSYRFPYFATQEEVDGTRPYAFFKYLLTTKSGTIRPTSRIHEVIDDPAVLRRTLEQGVTAGVLRPLGKECYEVDYKELGEYMVTDLHFCLVNAFNIAATKGSMILAIIDLDKPIVANFSGFEFHFFPKIGGDGWNIHTIVNPKGEVPEKLPPFGEFKDQCSAEVMIMTDPDYIPTRIRFACSEPVVMSQLTHLCYRDLPNWRRD